MKADHHQSRMNAAMLNGDHQPLIKGRLGKERSVFAPGHRIRMNIVPMFLNIFIPWAFFVFVCGTCAFSLMYRHPGLATGILVSVFVIWVAACYMALSARKFNPDPTWYTYLAIMVGVFALSGGMYGRSLYEGHMKHYFQLSDLRLAKGVNAGAEKGDNLMDAGIIYFGSGNMVDSSMAYHFKQKTIYCVAPVLTNRTTPQTFSYDFWMVGKDCCSVGSPDFRCGDWESAAKGALPSGIRVLSDHDDPFYRLAVQQAESTYGITAEHPIFLEWAQDPVLEMAIWNKRVFKNYLFANGVAFITSWFCMSVVAAAFAWIGRGETRCDFQDFSDPSVYDTRRNVHHRPGAQLQGFGPRGFNYMI